MGLSSAIHPQGATVERNRCPSAAHLWSSGLMGSLNSAPRMRSSINDQLPFEVRYAGDDGRRHAPVRGGQVEDQ
jgi:hypothetical protein